MPREQSPQRVYRDAIPLSTFVGLFLAVTWLMPYYTVAAIQEEMAFTWLVIGAVLWFVGGFGWIYLTISGGYRHAP